MIVNFANDIVVDEDEVKNFLDIYDRLVLLGALGKKAIINTIKESNLENKNVSELATVLFDEIIKMNYVDDVNKLVEEMLDDCDVSFFSD